MRPRPCAGGVLVLDDSGDRKDGHAAAYVGHEWLCRSGRTDRSVVTVTTVWAEERIYNSLHAGAVQPLDTRSSAE
jgi:hypothetical protein